VDIDRVHEQACECHADIRWHYDLIFSHYLRQRWGMVSAKETVASSGY
jgi:hypothetical protein